jgi:hypothetical protein
MLATEMVSDFVSFDSQLRYKPWWIAQHLTAPASYSKASASHGLDNYFVDHAMKLGKRSADWSRLMNM